MAKKPAHNFEGKCSLCHLNLSDGKRIFVKEIDFLCKDCHGGLGLSHPSGLKPSMPIPDKFPLDWAGRVTCATCHDVHGSSEFLLRGEKIGRIFVIPAIRELWEGMGDLTSLHTHEAL